MSPTSFNPHLPPDANIVALIPSILPTLFALSLSHEMNEIGESVEATEAQESAGDELAIT